MGTFSAYTEGKPATALPDGWYVASMDNGIYAGPFPLLRIAKLYASDPEGTFKEYGRLLHDQRRSWIGKRDDLIRARFDTVSHDWVPEEPQAWWTTPRRRRARGGE